MAYDFGMKVGVDGESEYKRALREINASLKTLGTEAKLVASEFDAQDKSVAALTARNEVLNRQIEEQKNKVSMLENALQNARNTYGENSQQVQTWQQQLNNAKAALNNMEREVKQNEAAIENTTDAEADGTKAVKKYGDETQETAKKSEAAAKVMKAVGAAMAATAAAVAAAAAAIVSAGKAIWNAANETAQAGDEIDKNSQKVGLSYEAYQKWDYAMKIAGTEMSSCTNGLKTLTNTFDDANMGSESAITKFERLGLSLEDLQGLSREDLFATVVTALQNVTDETEKAALANDMFGKSGQELLPLFNMTEAELQSVMNECEEYGMIMSDDAVKASAAFQDSLTKLQSTFTGVKNRLLGELLPAFTSILGGIADVIAGNEKGTAAIESGAKGLIKELTKMIPQVLSIVSSVANAVLKSAPEIIEGLADGLMTAVPSLLDTVLNIAEQVLGTILSILPDLINTVANMAGQVVKTIGKALPSVIRTILSILPSLLETVVSLVSDVVDTLVDCLPEVLSAITEGLKQTLLKIAEVLPDLIDTVLTLIIGVVNAILGATPELVQAIAEVLPVILEAILNCLPQIIMAVVSIVTSIAQNLPQIIMTIVELIPTLIESIIKAIISCLPALLQAVIQLVLAIVENLPTIIVSIIKAIPTLITSIINAIINCLPQLIQCVVQLVAEIVKNLPQIILQIIRSIPQLMKGILDSIGSTVGSFVEIGGNLVKGLWQGIQGLAGWIWDKVSGWASDLWNGILDFFGIHSPSKKFAWVGENLGLGLTEGFVDTMDDAEKDIRDAIPQDFDIDARANLRSVTADVAPSVAASSGGVSAGSTSDQEQIYLLKQQNSLLQQILEKSMDVVIGDDAIGRANTRYNNNRGLTLNEGVYANAY